MRWLAVVIALAACKDGADVVKEYRPKVEARLAQMVTAVNASPAATPAIPEKLRFTGARPNALLIEASWLTGQQSADTLLTRTGDLITVKDALRGDTSGVPSYYEHAFKTVLGAKYLVVVDVYIATGTVTAEREFGGGGVSGSLNVVDIDAAKSLGSFSLSAEHGDKVDVTKGAEEKGLHSDLWMKGREAVNQALAPYLAPGEKPPL